ncbi:MAG: hypothetical protein EA385_00600 [Salinarimonadaceae bacterium]|nr:MAG: hypothetical protein EA385_00600 [Salinarimonadaceae bacterium]
MATPTDPVRINELNPPADPELEAIVHAEEASGADRKYTLAQILGLIARTAAPAVPAGRVTFATGPGPADEIDLQSLLADLLARVVLDPGAFGGALAGAESPEQALEELGFSAYFTSLIGAEDVSALLDELGIGQVARGEIFGLTASNNATDAVNDLDFAAGAAASDDATPVLLTPGAMTKRLDAEWGAGDGAGGRVPGQSLADGTWHCFAFRRSGGEDDFCLSNALSFTLPAGGTHRRRIWSVRRVSGSIVPFIQRGDECLLLSSAADVNVSDPGTSAALRVVSAPTGIEVEALLTATGFNGGGAANHTLITSPSMNDTTPSGTNFTFRGVGSSMSGGSGQLRVRTNASAQIRTRSDVSNANQGLVIVTHGWIDRRGRDA